MSSEKSNSRPKHGKPRITLADIAQRAGVSKGVVSVALHGSEKGNIRVGAATVKKIKALAKELGYIPNQAARQLSMRRSGMWGILCDSKPSELNAARLALLHRAARAKGYRIIVEYLDEKCLDLESIIEVFHNLGVEGVICLHHYFPNQHMLVPQLMTQHFERVVFIDRPDIENPHFCGVDYVEAGRMAYRALRRISERPGLILKNLFWYSGPLLAQGFTEAFSADHPNPDYDPVWTAEAPGEEESPFFDITTARRALDSWALPNKLTGLAAWNDERGSLIINALHERGLQVPGDVAVIGLGNARICKIIRPTLSSIDLQIEKTIGTAAEILSELCKGGQPGKETWMEPRLHLRMSCPPHPEDREG